MGTFTKASLLLAALLALTRAPVTSAANSVVTEWLTIAQSTVFTLSLDHQYAARLYALVATSQYDAIVKAVKAGVSPEAAAAYASHAVLSHLFNWRQTAIYDVALVRHLQQYGVPDSGLPTLQKLIMPQVQTLLASRLRDGSSYFANFKPANNSRENFGRYQFTLGQTTARYPQVATSTGFHLTDKEVDLFTSGLKRFALDDPEYARQLQQVYQYGYANSTVRSAYDSTSPRFWALGGGTGTVAGLWVNVSISVIPDSTPLIHQARFFKILATSFWDASVACWRVKYRELFWRPITAIWTNHGLSPFDLLWTPLLPTPPHPEYPSGHQCTSGVAVYVLEAHLGTNTAFSVVSSGAPDVAARPYTSFRAAGIECGDSRMYGGIHFNKSNIDGLNLGYNIAKYIHTTKFKSSTFKTKL